MIVFGGGACYTEFVTKGKQGMNVWGTLESSAAYLIVLAGGYVLKRLGVFRVEHAKLLSKVIMTITLPAAVLHGAAGAEFDRVLVITAGMALALNICLLGAAVLVSRGLPGKSRALCVLNTNTFNDGNFAMPFLSAFVGADAFAAICMFDMGSALTTFGPNFALAQGVMGAQEGKRTGPGQILKSLVSSPTFDIYLLVILINVTHWQLPAILDNTVAMAANANTFIAMLTIGILFDLKFQPGGAGLILRVLCTRYALCAAASVLIWLWMPAPPETVRTLCITVFAPIANCATIFTVQHGCDGAVSAVINSLSMLVSIIVMLTLLMVLPMPVR